MTVYYRRILTWGQCSEGSTKDADMWREEMLEMDSLRESSVGFLCVDEMA